MSTDNSVISSVCLNWEVSRRLQTTYSLVIMSIGGNRVWKPSVCCWPTKSIIRKHFFFFVAIMNVLLSTASTDSMMSANDGSV
ncbi:hypothetical protein P879_08334 [Paragonimus westermani]|uniref:Uncharacterized protein n=1 Tax=Paragonimus westermani TaxID=34504 RepID=A0A8T0DFS8_9TREM|nr:hypothetical protein P879_08334 [Paragonimus westermani]